MIPRAPIVIESLSDQRHPAFSAALRLYNRVFPEKERIDRRYFVDMLREKRMGLLFPFNIHFLVARSGKRVLGLATGSYLAIVNIGFVGYLAVDPRLKGSRIGSRLRHRLVEEIRHDARAVGRRDLFAIMGEVEANNPWLRHLVKKNRVLALDLDYRQPALSDNAPAVPLVLYVEPLRAPMRSLPTAQLRTLLYAIYRRVYRMRFPLRDRAFRRMLKQLDARQRVGARRL